MLAICPGCLEPELDSWRAHGWVAAAVLRVKPNKHLGLDDGAGRRIKLVQLLSPNGTCVPRLPHRRFCQIRVES
jgi:hypothetical protein